MKLKCTGDASQYTQEAFRKLVTLYLIVTQCEYSTLSHINGQENSIPRGYGWL